MIPLASDLLPCPDQMRREGHLKSASPPDRLSSSGRIAILGTISHKCPAALTAPVDKIIACDRSARRVFAACPALQERRRSVRRVRRGARSSPGAAAAPWPDVRRARPHARGFSLHCAVTATAPRQAGWYDYMFFWTATQRTH